MLGISGKQRRWGKVLLSWRVRQSVAPENGSLSNLLVPWSIILDTFIRVHVRTCMHIHTCDSLPDVMLHLIHIRLHWITSYYITLHAKMYACIHYILFHYVTLHSVTFHNNTLHALQYTICHIAIDYITFTCAVTFTFAIAFASIVTLTSHYIHNIGIHCIYFLQSILHIAYM